MFRKVMFLLTLGMEVKLPPAKPGAYWMSASKAPRKPGAAQGGPTSQTSSGRNAHPRLPDSGCTPVPSPHPAPPSKHNNLGPRMSAQTASLSFSIFDDGFEWHSLTLSNLSPSLNYISVERSGACGYGRAVHCLLPIPHPYVGMIPGEFLLSSGEVSHK